MASRELGPEMSIQPALPRRRFLLVAGGGLLGALAAACAPGKSGASADRTTAPTTAPALTGLTAIEAAAKPEGEVTLYVVGQDIGDAWSAGFKAAYPWAKVNVFAAGLPDIQTRFVAEFNAGVPGADVMLQPLFAGKALAKQGLVATATPPAQAKINAAFLDPDHQVHPWSVALYFPVYNANILKTPIKTFEELADPKWKGQLTWDRPSARGVSFVLMSAQRKPMGDAKWRTWLNGLKNNEPLFAASATAAYQSVLRGERVVAFDSYSDVGKQPAGTPVAAAFIDNMIGLPNMVVISKKAPHPNMAVLFTNWLESEAGQTVISDSGRTPALDIPSPVSVGKIVPTGTRFGDLTDVAADPDFFANVYRDLWPSG